MACVCLVKMECNSKAQQRPLLRDWKAYGVPCLSRARVRPYYVNLKKDELLMDMLNSHLNPCLKEAK